MQLPQQLAANSLCRMGRETGSKGRDFLADGSDFSEPRKDSFTVSQGGAKAAEASDHDRGVRPAVPITDAAVGAADQR
jgi:hypothetical protein